MFGHIVISLSKLKAPLVLGTRASTGSEKFGEHLGGNEVSEAELADRTRGVGKGVFPSHGRELFACWCLSSSHSGHVVVHPFQRVLSTCFVLYSKCSCLLHVFDILSNPYNAQNSTLILRRQTDVIGYLGSPITI